jgi:hypothetical protein
LIRRLEAEESLKSVILVIKILIKGISKGMVGNWVKGLFREHNQ